MDGYLKQQAVQLALEQLMKTSAGEKFQQAVQLIQSMQEHLTALSEKEEAVSVTGVKAATVLTLGVLKKIAGGKNPSSFDAEDWEELAHTVSEYAVLLDGEQYLPSYIPQITELVLHHHDYDLPKSQLLQLLMEADLIVNCYESRPEPEKAERIRRIFQTAAGTELLELCLKNIT